MGINTIDKLVDEARALSIAAAKHYPRAKKVRVDIVKLPYAEAIPLLQSRINQAKLLRGIA